MSRLPQLEQEIAAARSLGLVPGAEALERWHRIVEDAVAAESRDWEGEPAFRMRTGAALKWCQARFGEYGKRGLARTDADGRREWHVSARPSKASDVRELEDVIVQSYRRAS